MVLYLLRHGLAIRKEDWQGEESQRPLTEVGVEQVQQVSRMLAALDLGIDAIISSPFRRTLQTAQIAARALGMEDKLKTDERLEEGKGLPGLASVLKDHAGVRVLMLSGHKADFGGALTEIIAGGNVKIDKGGLARIDLTSIDPPSGQLTWLLPPDIVSVLA